MHERGSAGVRATIVFLVVAAVLAGALWGADSYVHGRVERELAARLQTELGTPAVPQVDVEGRPFLTQVAARSIRSVHLVADDVGSTNDAALPIRHVDMTLTDVTTNDWWKTMTVSLAQGTALVDYAALQKSAGVPLTYVGGGRFSVQSDTNVLGASVPVKVTGRLALDVRDQTVSLADARVEIKDYPLPDAVARALVDTIVKPVPLQGVPFDLQVVSVDPQDDGLHAGLRGENIPVQR